MPVSFHPLSLNMLQGFDGKGDGTNAFTLSRFLVPSLCNFEGWALFLDGDMVVDIDIAELWAWRIALHDKAVGVVKHAYTPRHPRKYVGTPMENVNIDYPKKNWSSVVLWNCAHPLNQQLTREFVAKSASKYLHRFEWLPDSAIGELSPGWNYLVGEQPPANAHLYHYTLGVPGMPHYSGWHASWKWHTALLRMLECAKEDQVAMVKRAQDAVGYP